MRSVSTARCGGALLLALLVPACSSQPSRLYVLNATLPAEQARAAAQSGASGLASAAAVPIGRARPGPAAVLGVGVTVPEYLDRLDIIERTGSNELKPNYKAQWGESLSVTATRSVAENLLSLLPEDDVLVLPARNAGEVDYQVTVELSRFESGADGESVLAGRWSVADRAGKERASGRVRHAEQAPSGDYAGMAAAMSRNLAAASAEIAAAVRRLPPPAP
jgi:uncharacterized lipoprotein YmbA